MSKHDTAAHPKTPRLRIMLPTGETYKRKVSEAESHIGSGVRNEILILDPDVSTVHAMLTSDGSGYFITDQGGVGGTFVNGERVTDPRKLANGDVIRIGQSEITFRLKHGGKAHKHHNGNGSPEVAAVTSTNGASPEKHKKKHKEHKKEHGHDKPRGAPQGQAAPLTEIKAAATNGEADVKKKKKEAKPGKSKEDERIKAAKVRAWGGIIATVLSVVLTVTISIVVSRTGVTQSTPPIHGSVQSAMKLAGLTESSRISGGTFEASGAVAVPGTNGVLFVDDSKPDRVCFMPLNETGAQDGPVEVIALGVSVTNPEGITQFGNRFIMVGSLSTNESDAAAGVAVFDFDAATRTVSKAVALTGMRKFLFDNVPELKAWTNKTSAEGGLNVEAIAVDPNPEHPRVLLGLRGPLLNGNALIVPVRVRDRQALITMENLEMDQPNAIQLNLNGQAIRDMQYDSRLGAFLIISGAPETEKKTDFTLWRWNGEANQANEEARPKQQAVLDKKMKPEGITRVKVSNSDFVFIIGDASRYAKMDYVQP